MENWDSTILISEQRLIELLLHQDKRVRDEVVLALEKYFSESPNVIKHLLKAFHIYKDDALSLICGIKSFLPSKEEVGEIFKIIAQITNNKDEKSMNIYFHLVNSLHYFPYDLITDYKDIFVFNEHLKKMYENIITRNQIKAQSHQSLWTELSNICKQNKGKHFDNNTRQYVNILVDGLLQYRDEIKHKVIMSLSQETTEYHFELYMVQIASRLKIKETIPSLFRILINSDFMDLVNEECTRALGKIGGREVVNQVEIFYPEHESLRAQFASILKWVPYNYSEDLAIRLLKNEQDLEQKTFLAEALCSMFSKKSINVITNMVKDKQYDPLIVDLSDLLVSVYEYHNQDYNISSLQIHAHQFVHEKTTTKDFPQREVSNDIINKKPIYKSGRNDPCPCGSGKKYKKCCLNSDNI
jgi:hypothetical protein